MPVTDGLKLLAPGHPGQKDRAWSGTLITIHLTREQPGRCCQLSPGPAAFPSTQDPRINQGGWCSFLSRQKRLEGCHKLVYHIPGPGARHVLLHEA